MTEDRAAIEGFAGIARLFPLPNLVLFPQVDQGLHIFEPRYRQMTADALATDQMIALAVLRPDWEREYDRSPPIETVACLGRIVQSELMSDGRYNLRLRGLARFQIEQELVDPEKLYRQASGTILVDVTEEDLKALVSLRHQLRDQVMERFDPASGVYRQLTEFFESDLPLSQLCDVLSYSLPFSTDSKMRLLRETIVTRRVGILIEAVRLWNQFDRPSPPVFSAN
jgi:uncharacterized protein